jgi:hypothetical protein
MIVACWSPKPGSGTSVVTAALATISCPSGADDAMLVDLGGDSSAILGQPTPVLGIGDLLDGTGGHRLSEVMVPLSERFSLLAPGFTPLPAHHESRWHRLADDLAAVSREGRHVFVDVAHPDIPDWLDEVVDHTVLVIRPCFLALRRAVEHRRSEHLADSAVLVVERDRALTPRDVVQVLHTPIAAEVPVHPDIARCIDAGLLLSRQPSRLAEPLRDVLVELV